MKLRTEKFLTNSLTFCCASKNLSVSEHYGNFANKTKKVSYWPIFGDFFLFFAPALRRSIFSFSFSVITTTISVCRQLYNFHFLIYLTNNVFFCFQLSEQCWINLIINKGPFVKGVKWLRNLFLACMVSHACFLFTNLEPQNNVTFSHTIRYDEHFWLEYGRKLSFK